MIPIVDWMDMKGYFVTDFKTAEVLLDDDNKNNRRYSAIIYSEFKQMVSAGDILPYPESDLFEESSQPLNYQDWQEITEVFKKNRKRRTPLSCHMNQPPVESESVGKHVKKQPNHIK